MCTCTEAYTSHTYTFPRFAVQYQTYIIIRLLFVLLYSTRSYMYIIYTWIDIIYLYIYFLFFYFHDELLAHAPPSSGRRFLCFGNTYPNRVSYNIIPHHRYIRNV